LLLVLLGRLSVHEVVEADTVLEKIVDASHDAENTEREDPNADDSHNGSLVSVKEPSEEGEEGCQKIDKQDSTGQLP
jgi:hypothetical protein